MSTRTQITMDPELQRRAHAKAAELGMSFAEYVRRLVAQDLGEPKRKADISLLFDLGASRQPTDIARDKRQMLGEEVWNEHLRKTSGKQPDAPARGVVDCLCRHLRIWRGWQDSMTTLRFIATDAIAIARSRFCVEWLERAPRVDKPA